jgi:hypothetical protein
MFGFAMGSSGSGQGGGRKGRNLRCPSIRNCDQFTVSATVVLAVMLDVVVSVPTTVSV